jgi:t-SNARE complex subunit (syntaxin)
MSYESFKNVQEVKNIEKLIHSLSDLRNLVSHYVTNKTLRLKIYKSMKEAQKDLDKEKFKNLK